MVENTAGDDVPKLMSAADEARDVSELTRLRLTDKAGGMPEVVKADDGAVAAIVEEIGCMVVPTPGELGMMVVLEADVAVALEESRGPRPLEREMAEATVGAPVAVTVVVVVTTEVTRGLVGRLSMDKPLRDGRVPTSVEDISVGTVIPGVEPPRMDTTAGSDVVSDVAGIVGVTVSTDSGFVHQPCVLAG